MFREWQSLTAAAAMHESRRTLFMLATVKSNWFAQFD
jgi:hypothetical protein